jgi:hypothetical protein
LLWHFSCRFRPLTRNRSFARVVFQNTYLGAIINPAGWRVCKFSFLHLLPTLNFWTFLLQPLSNFTQSNFITFRVYRGQWYDKHWQRHFRWVRQLRTRINPRRRATSKLQWAAEHFYHYRVDSGEFVV